MTHISLKSRSLFEGRILFIALASVGLLAAACVQESGAYPIETFTEMHYSQAHRSQEIPRNTQEVLNVLPANEAHPYDAKAGSDLYRVNCSACHGVKGLGNGPAAAHITSPNSTYADGGNTYTNPPNLQESRTRLSQDAVFGILTNGIVVMPRFGPILSEQERWDIVRYMFDTSETGMGQ